MLSNHSTTELDPSLIFSINISTVYVGKSLAVYQNTMSSKLFFAKHQIDFLETYGLTQTLYGDNVLFILVSACSGSEEQIYLFKRHLIRVCCLIHT